MIKTFLTQGTKEHLIFTWTPRLANIASLNGTDPVFDVTDADTGFYYYRNAASDMVVQFDQYCLIDTTISASDSPSGGGVWVLGVYNIWVKLTAGLGDEEPRAGKFQFRIID